MSTLLLIIAAVYAGEIHTYRCEKCGLIESFDSDKEPMSPYYPKCPKDGGSMWKIN